MSRTGRPPKPEGERRDEDMRMRVTPEEKQALRQAAKTNGKDFSDWARELLLKSAHENKETATK